MIATQLNPGDITVFTPPRCAERLTCHAPHPDPKKDTETCDGPAGQLAAGMKAEFIGLVRRVPDRPTIHIYGICAKCRAVNKFRIVSTEPKT